MVAGLKEVLVTAPARLHLGFLDLDGALGRRFGSLGLTIDGLSTRISLGLAPAFDVTGVGELVRARSLVEALAAAWNLPPARITIEATIPAHTGLGSGTQLALALGVGLARLAGRGTTAREVAQLLERGRRSGIGLGAFEQGGFLLDGGRADDGQPPPIIARLPFPDGWRLLLIFDGERQGLHGTSETGAFGSLPPYPPELAAQLCRLVVMRLLPGLATADLGAVGAAIGEVQARVGDYFAAGPGRALHQPGGERGAGLARGPGHPRRRPELAGVPPGSRCWTARLSRKRSVPSWCDASPTATPPCGSGHLCPQSRRRGRRHGVTRRPWQIAGTGAERSRTPGEAPMTEPKSILHFITPLKNVSPFDVNMAADAGFDVIVPYSDVDLKEVAGLVQDAIFSRAPQDGRRTAVLIGGREPILAVDMLDAAKNAMVPPYFELSVMADPSGAFTTAAGMIAVVEKRLQATGATLENRHIAIFGGTGPVGRVAGLIAAQAGARVTLVGYDGLQRVTATCEQFGERFGVAHAPRRRQRRCQEAQGDRRCRGDPGRRPRRDADPEQGRSAPPPAGCWSRSTSTRCRPPGSRASTPSPMPCRSRAPAASGSGALALGNVKFKTERELWPRCAMPSPRRYIGVAARRSRPRAGMPQAEPAS